MDFLELLENNLNVSITENGAAGFNTTGKSLLDMNFKVSSYRNMSDEEIINDFSNSFKENPLYSLRWLFYIRDIRFGLGERRLFKVILHHIACNSPELVVKVLYLIPEYGRGDDLFCLFNTPVEKDMLRYICDQLLLDVTSMKKGVSISLLGKWMPSLRASSKEKRIQASKIRKYIKIGPKVYSNTLKELRKYLDVVEKKMSNNEWDLIDYSRVPSKANLIYEHAFLRHDSDRRRKFIQNVKDGKESINSNTNYPYEIVNKYDSLFEKNDTLEELWNALPKSFIMDNTLVVADGSGSMTCGISKSSNASALDVANSIAIYCSEYLNGPYHNKYITFSNRPRYVNFDNCNSLFDKILTAKRHNEMSNTNIEAVFDLILKTAIDNDLKQEDLPKNVLIISDMEFDIAQHNNNFDFDTSQDKLFESIHRKYKNYKYELPRLIFWNVVSRTKTIPLKENKNGVILISGFSPNVLNMLGSNELDPYKVLLDQLNDKRYSIIDYDLFTD